MASLIAQLVKHLSAVQESPVQFLGEEDPLEKGLSTHPVFLGFPCGSAGKESSCNAGDLGQIPGLGRSPGEGKGYPLQFSGLENSVDRIVHGVTRSQTRLSDFPFHFTFRIARSYDKSLFNVQRNQQTVLHSGSIILHFQQLCTRIPIFFHSCHISRIYKECLY